MPNCVFVAFFSVYLVDGVTGATIHHTTHRNAVGPVNLDLSENWIVVSCHGHTTPTCYSHLMSHAPDF